MPSYNPGRGVSPGLPDPKLGTRQQQISRNHNAENMWPVVRASEEMGHPPNSTSRAGSKKCLRSRRKCGKRQLLRDVSMAGFDGLKPPDTRAALKAGTLVPIQSRCRSARFGPLTGACHPLPRAITLSETGSHPRPPHSPKPWVFNVWWGQGSENQRLP